MKTLPSVLLCLCVASGVALAGPMTDDRRSSLETALHSAMALSTPDLSRDAREDVIGRYFKSKYNKALAVQPTYRRYFVSELHEDEEMAGDRTLEACQLRFAMPCALVAINDRVVMEEQPVLRTMPRLAYSGQFDLSKIPIITQDTRYRSDVQKYLGFVGPKAIAIHPLGTLFAAFDTASTKEAQEAVLEKCNRDFIRANAEGPCFVYSVGDVVVLSERRNKLQ